MSKADPWTPRHWLGANSTGQTARAADHADASDTADFLAVSQTGEPVDRPLAAELPVRCSRVPSPEPVVLRLEITVAVSVTPDGQVSGTAVGVHTDTVTGGLRGPGAGPLGRGVGRRRAHAAVRS